MIRSLLTCAVIAGAVVTVDVEAAAPIEPMTIVQTDSLGGLDQGFGYFNSSLGTLQSVELEITPNFRRFFQIVVPGNVSTTSITWDAAGKSYCRHGACPTIVASGSADLALTYSETLFGGSSYAYLFVNFGGITGSTNLDPTQWINPPFEGARRFLAQADPGLYDQSLTDIFQVPGGGYARNANGFNTCGSSVAGCDLSLYKLTFSYAPGGVPEPATWGMMLLGFGAMGAALRRRRKITTTIRYA